VQGQSLRWGLGLVPFGIADLGGLKGAQHPSRARGRTQSVRTRVCSRCT